MRDNGTGFDSSGNDQSMGCQLMQGCAEQLGGSYASISSAETGTEVRLDFQINPSACPA